MVAWYKIYWSCSTTCNIHLQVQLTAALKVLLLVWHSTQTYVSDKHPVYYNYLDGRVPNMPPAHTNRPHSTKLFTKQSRYPCNLPSYTEDYGPKPLVATPCVRSGTSSGNRRNNPHPSEVRILPYTEEIQLSTLLGICEYKLIIFPRFSIIIIIIIVVAL